MLPSTPYLDRVAVSLYEDCYHIAVNLSYQMAALEPGKPPRRESAKLC
jgi:hypothetical protein